MYNYLFIRSMSLLIGQENLESEVWTGSIANSSLNEEVVPSDLKYTDGTLYIIVPGYPSDAIKIMT